MLAEVAAELVAPEDVAVFARGFAQFAVELAERAIGGVGRVSRALAGTAALAAGLSPDARSARVSRVASSAVLSSKPAVKAAPVAGRGGERAANH